MLVKQSVKCLLGVQVGEFFFLFCSLNINYHVRRASKAKRENGQFTFRNDQKRFDSTTCLEYLM